MSNKDRTRNDFPMNVLAPAENGEEVSQAYIGLCRDRDPDCDHFRQVSENLKVGHCKDKNACRGIGGGRCFDEVDDVDCRHGCGRYDDWMGRTDYPRDCFPSMQKQESVEWSG